MFRLWSTPVYRWLWSCIYTPILYPGIKTNPSSMKRELAIASPVSVSNTVAKGGVRKGSDSAGISPTTAFADCSEDKNKADGSNIVAPLGKAAGRDVRGQDELEKRRPISSGRHVLAMLFAFVFSSAVHEAMAFIAMRRTFWPINSFSLILCVVVISRWDRMYPLQYLISVERGASSTEVGQQAEVPGIPRRKLIGSEWRGWGAVAYFEITSIPISLFYDFLSWQWWRYTHLRHD